MSLKDRRKDWLWFRYEVSRDPLGLGLELIGWCVAYAIHLRPMRESRDPKYLEFVGRRRNEIDRAYEERARRGLPERENWRRVWDEQDALHRELEERFMRGEYPYDRSK